MKLLSRLMAILFVSLWLPDAARACPFCDSVTAQQVRAQLFGPHFGADLAATLLPFPLFGGIVALIYSGNPLRGRHADKPSGGPEEAE